MSEEIDIHMKYIREDLKEIKNSIKHMDGQVEKNKEKISKINFKVNSVGGVFTFLWSSFITWYSNKHH